jgi:hypothetical protein
VNWTDLAQDGISVVTVRNFCIPLEGAFLEQLRDCLLLNEDSATWSYLLS